MEKKKLTGLSLHKEVIGTLNNDELKDAKGGWTTTIGECTHLTCCEKTRNCEPQWSQDTCKTLDAKECSWEKCAF
ncbi:MAG: class I lanthipeptide [Rikenella sp.]|nr:class I lanthipeptide [Rikenella sp.]